MSHHRKRRLSDEERALWERVQRTARPLSGRRIIAPEPSTEPAPDTAPAAEPPPLVHQTAASPPRRPAQLPDIDLNTRRKIARGRIGIDARIDLHAMTQGEAHARLFGFLSRAQADGLRHVLVITGKGSSLASDGILKRSVPLWFATPAFRPLVSGYDWADRRHGGDGALYVRIRRGGRM